MIFNFQNLKCSIGTKSVSGTHEFKKGEIYRFAVIKHNDYSDSCECVFKFPHHNGELVDTRYFDDYDINFMYDPYYQILSKFDTTNKKNITTPREEILFGGSEAECREYFNNLRKEYDGMLIYVGLIRDSTGKENQFTYRKTNIDYTIQIVEK